MKGRTIASRARRRLELKAGKAKKPNQQITDWMEPTDENIAWLAEKISDSKRIGRIVLKAIEQRKSGKKTGLIALARVT